MINEIKNNKSLVVLLTRQLGGIIGIELGIIICSFFVDMKIIRTIQLCVIPVILIIIFSKYTKPLVNVKIDYSDRLLLFNNAIIGKYCRLTRISFEQLYVQKRWKWLLNIYQEVVEIKEGKATRIVIPVIENKKFVDHFIQEVIKLKDSNHINENQISNNLMH
jgi:hypothetical protein